MIKYRFMIVIVCLFLLGMSACQSADIEATTPLPDEEAYPSFTEEKGYPAVDDSGYPVASEPNLTFPQGPEFEISEPVAAGDTVVSGTGPANVPLKLVDVSQVGEILAETVIEEDGTFTFDLDEPLTARHLIGLQLGDLSGTDLIEADFLYSDTYYVRPLVGILFDMVTVQ